MIGSRSEPVKSSVFQVVSFSTTKRVVSKTRPKGEPMEKLDGGVDEEFYDWREVEEYKRES